jgi:2-keto-4-pentenoate hydratase/2-oxohepta-3-ene-1,7-dioic acid hydratase in catechol pathway
MAGPRGSVPLPGLRPAVNSEVVQDGRTHHMVYTVGDTLSLISHTFILRSGGLLATGTPSGGRSAA